MNEKETLVIVNEGFPSFIRSKHQLRPMDDGSVCIVQAEPKQDIPRQGIVVVGTGSAALATILVDKGVYSVRKMEIPEEDFQVTTEGAIATSIWGSKVKPWRFTSQYLFDMKYDERYRKLHSSKYYNAHQRNKRIAKSNRK